MENIKEFWRFFWCYFLQYPNFHNATCETVFFTWRKLSAGTCFGLILGPVSVSIIGLLWHLSSIKEGPRLSSYHPSSQLYESPLSTRNVYHTNLNSADHSLTNLNSIKFSTPQTSTQQTSAQLTSTKHTSTQPTLPQQNSTCQQAHFIQPVTLDFDVSAFHSIFGLPWHTATNSLWKIVCFSYSRDEV